MARNAVRSDVFNISSAGNELTPVQLELRGLPTEHLEVCEVPLVDTKEFEPCGAGHAREVRTGPIPDRRGPRHDAPDLAALLVEGTAGGSI